MREKEQRSRRHAKSLRGALTNAETILRSRLRRDAVEGFRFRRQHPIGPYIADFACVPARLVIEIDGATHFKVGEIARDERREAYLRARGWHVLRINNDDVYKHLSDVLQMIWAALPPSPVPDQVRDRTSPASGGGDVDARLNFQTSQQRDQ